MSDTDRPEKTENEVRQGGSSLASRLFDVIAAPGEVFDEVKTAPDRTSNWLGPAILVSLVGILGALLCFSQPAIQQQMSDLVTEQLQKQAKRVPMDERARAIGESVGQKAMRISMIAEPVATGFVMPFWWGLVIWVVGGKLLKGGYTYMKAVEVAGLANVVTALEYVVKTLLQIGFGNLMAGPHLALLIRDFDPTKPGHGALVALNLFWLWALAIRSLGMAKLGGMSFGKAAGVLFGLWFLFMGGSIGVGVLMQRLAGQ
ncbi:MAG: YIP1 family protein [Verrucomicrobia bacterium]|nr:YIP1 family protein [Verrucomicrobiota bacterium]